MATGPQGEIGTVGNWYNVVSEVAGVLTLRTKNTDTWVEWDVVLHAGKVIVPEGGRLAEWSPADFAIRYTAL